MRTREKKTTSEESGKRLFVGGEFIFHINIGPGGYRVER